MYIIYIYVCIYICVRVYAYFYMYMYILEFLYMCTHPEDSKEASPEFPGPSKILAPVCNLKMVLICFPLHFTPLHFKKILVVQIMFLIESFLSAGLSCRLRGSTTFFLFLLGETSFVMQNLVLSWILLIDGSLVSLHEKLQVCQLWKKRRECVCCSVLSVLQSVVSRVAVVLKLCPLWKKRRSAYVAVCCSVLQNVVSRVAVVLKLCPLWKKKRSAYVAVCYNRSHLRGLFCKRALSKRLYSAKETNNCKEPASRSHLIGLFCKRAL